MQEIAIVTYLHVYAAALEDTAKEKTDVEGEECAVPIAGEDTQRHTEDV